MTDLGLIPVWLLIIAASSLLQVAVLVTVALSVRRSTERMARTLEGIERTQIAPLVAHLHGALDDINEVVQRVRAADDDVRRVVNETTEKARDAAALIRTRLWPALTLARGLLAAVTTLKDGKHRRVS